MYATWRLPERGASLRGKKVDLVERLEMYDKHCNLAQSDPDTEEISMEIPPTTTFKDVNSNTVLPPLSTTLIRQYLNFTTKKLDQALHLYESRFLTVVIIIIIRSSWTEDSCYIKLNYFLRLWSSLKLIQTQLLPHAIQFLPVSCSGKIFSLLP
ncbi:unnamed protein product [Pieris brassicae]|uniref:SAP domain-containing protein n=1 Tax=Pieris brassicae TaxID=7116 RepID=A0A9P0TV83_PIEBR|nr:unnamed protein product [Pieris brassicae]